MIKLKHIFLITLFTLIVSKGFAFEELGQISQDLFTEIQDSILKQVNIVSKGLAKYVASLLASLYSIWLIWKAFKAILDNNIKDVVQLLFKQSAVLICVLFFIYNIDIFNKFVQKPIVDVYNAFGQTLLSISSGISISENSGLIKETADNIFNTASSIMDGNWNPLTNLLPILISAVVLIMLFIVFIQIFLILLTNYFKIMLPFAISPILLMFFFFPSLRQIPIKALNIALDGVIKQGFIIMVVTIMAEVFENNLTATDKTFLTKMLVILIVSFIYKQLLTTADSLSSELIGTQQLGVNPTQGGGLLGAIAGAGTTAISYLNKGDNTSLGGLTKGLTTGVISQGISTGDASSLQGKAGNLVGSAIGSGLRKTGETASDIGKLGWKLGQDNFQAYQFSNELNKNLDKNFNSSKAQEEVISSFMNNEFNSKQSNSENTKPTNKMETIK